ncbi:MAG: prolyl oligopeptidase family serine peptidase [Verrucomicrobiota bacterium]
MFPVRLNRRVILSLLLIASVSTSFAADAKKAAPQPAAKAKAKQSLPPNPKKLSPPPGFPVSAEAKVEIMKGVAVLDREILALRTSLKGQPKLLELLPDVQIYRNAAAYAVEDDIFYSTNQTKSALAMVKQGMDRAAQLKAGQAPWTTATGLVVRGFVSKLDGSVQPYGLVVPASFKPGNKPMRLDFWLHGRGDTLNEISFIEGRQKSVGEFAPENTFVLHPYGRFMNAFKFAGEVDVFEGLAHAMKHYPIDAKRVSMRGFSMGGAGTWHLGVHHADQWAAVNPGAGFVDVKNYQKLGDKLDTIPWYEQKLWAMYDPLVAPINLVNTTLIAYSGELDGQKAAADLMEAALAKEGVKMMHLIGPKVEHKYEPETKKKVAALVDAAAAKGVTVPKKVTLVTHTLKWNKMHWVTVNALEKHWEEARIEAEIVGGKELQVRTKNITDISFSIPLGLLADENLDVVIDGQKNPKGVWRHTDRVWIKSFQKTGGKWFGDAGGFESRPLGFRKQHDRQGPIDDAFMSSFIMVKPTGQPLNPQAGQWAQAEMKEAIFQWRRQFRGPAQVKDDGAISDEDIKNNNLILWGDPASNKVLAKIADKLPIKWTAKGVQVGDKTYDATKNAPVLIYPNPLNPSKYVVINCGFTFPQYSSGTNSQQTPKLPDWAVVEMSVPSGERVGGKGVVDAAFFGEQWELTAVRK